MTAITASVLDELRALAGPKGFISDPAAMEPYLRDWRGLYQGRAALVLRPDSTAQVAAIVKLCQRTGTKIVPQSGNTSLVGGGVPFSSGDEILLSLSRMKRVRALDAQNGTITAEAGCILSDVHKAAAAAGRLFPLRIGSEDSCQVGGLLSTNAGGHAVLRYGNMRDLTLGLEVVTADGQVWDGLRGLRKDNTGYDLKQLFIGAEGTLGIITAAVLKLYSAPRVVETAFAAVQSPAAAVELLQLAQDHSGHQVTGFELFPRICVDLVLRHIPGTRAPLKERHDWHVLIEMHGGQAGGGLREIMEAVLATGAERGLVIDATVAASEAQAAAIWKLRDSITEAQRLEGASIKCDISVPVSRIAEFIQRGTAAIEGMSPGVRMVAFGHIGDGNVHFNPLQPVGADGPSFLAQWQALTRRAHDLAHELGGSISAEHGVGRQKRDEIRRYKPPVEMAMMEALKRALDPRGIFNPGKVV
jgi:FAD/FMN-containing dehydrogenase